MHIYTTQILYTVRLEFSCEIQLYMKLCGPATCSLNPYHIIMIMVHAYKRPRVFKYVTILFIVLEVVEKERKNITVPFKSVLLYPEIINIIIA